MNDLRFALAGQWPDSSNLFLAHLQNPQFVAEADDRVSHPRFFVTWLPEVRRPRDEVFGALMRRAAEFFFEQVTGKKLAGDTPVEFIEGRHRRYPPKFLLAINAQNRTFIIEPNQPGGIAEVIDWTSTHPDLLVPRFNQTSQTQLIEMRQYYQEYLQKVAAPREYKEPTRTRQKK